VILPVLDLSGEQATLAGQAERLITAGFARYARLEVIAGEELTARLRASEGYQVKDLGNARAFAQVGQQEYAQIQLKSAIQHLGRAAKTFEEIHHDLVQPEEVAQSLLALAKASLESGDQVAADLVFSRLLLVDPALRLAPGRHPDSVLAHYQRGRARALRERSTLLARMDKALAVGRQLHAGYVVLSLLGPAEGGLLDGGPAPAAGRLGVLLFDVRRRIQLAPVEELLPAPGAPLAERLDLATSRLAACIPNDVWLAQQRNPTPVQRRLEFDTGFAHLVYLDHPLHQAFQSFGLGTGVTWSPVEHLALVARLSFTTSSNNHPFEDLLDPVNVVRAILGAGFTVVGRRLAGYTVTGFDLSWPLAFRWTLDPDCKFHEPAPSSCTIRRHEPGPLFGLHVGAGGQWLFADPLFLNLRVGLSRSLLPAEGNRLNFPVTSEVGLGYRF